MDCSPGGQKLYKGSCVPSCPQATFTSGNNCFGELFAHFTMLTVLCCRLRAELPYLQLRDHLLAMQSTGSASKQRLRRRCERSLGKELIIWDLAQDASCTARRAPAQQHAPRARV